jgi:hypothetical protein
MMPLRAPPSAFQQVPKCSAAVSAAVVGGVPPSLAGARCRHVCFGEGHGFSRAGSSRQKDRASAPEGEFCSAETNSRLPWLQPAPSKLRAATGPESPAHIEATNVPYKEEHCTAG